MGWWDDARAVGTLERDPEAESWNHFSRPYGTGILVEHTPALKRRGYYQASLWDAAALALVLLVAANRISASLSLLPDATRVGTHHRLSRAASKGVCELVHVAHYVVHAIAVERVPLRENGRARDFGTNLAAPHVGVGEKESLQLGRRRLRTG